MPSSISPGCPKRIPKNYEEKLTPHFRDPRFFEIGYTGGDFFDNNHVDYEVCCGCCHTKNSGKVLSVLSFIANIVIAILLYYDEQIVFCALLTICAVFNVIHVVVVFKERPTMMIPSISDLCLLLAITCSEVYSAYKHNSASESFNGLMEILTTLIITPFFALTWWILWILIIHYFYIRDKPRNFDLTKFVASSPPLTPSQKIRRNLLMD